MIINYDGQPYPFDMDDVTVKQALAIEKFMGCPFAEWGKKLEAGGPGREDEPLDMRAIQTLGWLILHGDPAMPIEDTDFKMNKLRQALDEAADALIAAAKPADDEPVPTVAASTARKRRPAASSPAS